MDMHDAAGKAGIMSGRRPFLPRHIEHIAGIPNPTGSRVRKNTGQFDHFRARPNSAGAFVLYSELHSRLGCELSQAKEPLGDTVDYLFRQGLVLAKKGEHTQKPAVERTGDPDASAEELQVLSAGGRVAELAFENRRRTAMNLPALPKDQVSNRIH